MRFNFTLKHILTGKPINSPETLYQLLEIFVRSALLKFNEILSLVVKFSNFTKACLPSLHSYTLRKLHIAS